MSATRVKIPWPRFCYAGGENYHGDLRAQSDHGWLFSCTRYGQDEKSCVWPPPHWVGDELTDCCPVCGRLGWRTWTLDGDIALDDFTEEERGYIDGRQAGASGGAADVPTDGAGATGESPGQRAETPGLPGPTRTGVKLDGSEGESSTVREGAVRRG